MNIGMKKRQGLRARYEALLRAGRAKRRKALRAKRLYENILDETQAGVVAHDMLTGRIFYGNSEIRRIYQVKGDFKDLGFDSRLYKERGKNHLKPDIEALRRGAVSKTVEIHESGRIYQVKGKIISWCGRETYIEYLYDITDDTKYNEQLQSAHEELQRKYQEELLYREKAVTDDVIASSRINLTHGYIEEMRIGTQDGFERKYHYAADLVSRITAFTNEIWLTEEQNHNMSIPNMLKRYGNGERNFYEEYMAELKDGRHVWLKTDAKLVQRPETAEIIAFSYSRNVTKEKVLTDILRRSMSFDFDEIFTVDSINGRVSLIAAGRYVLDDQMREGGYEEELKNLKNRTASKEEGEQLEQALTLPHIIEVLKRDGVFLYEAALLSKNGKCRLKQLRFIYLHEEMGTLLFTITDVEDVAIAEKKKQEELEVALQMAEEANAAKMNFLASMSHEIRTPMNVIIGLIELIKEEADHKDQVLDCAEKLEASSRYLLALLNDILDMSRLESGNVELQRQEFETKAFWENVNTLAWAQAQAAGVRYIFDEGENLAQKYVGDAVRLQQILINLINNAMKFTPSGGTVRVTVRQEEVKNRRAKLVISVSDTGIGMSKEFLPNVFHVFTQEHDGMTSAYGGSGLGLSIARSYANLMDGDIMAASEEGKGTTFTTEVWLDLPSGGAAEKEVIKPDKKEEKLFAGKRVLLAEDHPLNTVVASRLLAKRGIEVITAVNGKEAVEQFKKSDPYSFDAVLMDVRMPVMNGLTAAEEIRKLSREDAKAIPIIAMTANAFDEDRKMTKQAGMDAHLAKPIEPQELYEKLEELL